jgi:hypothetical protein
MIEQGGVFKYPEQQGEIIDIAQIVLTSSLVTSVAGGTIQGIEGGNVENFSGPGTGRNWKGLARDPQQFNDALLEMRLAAWHTTRGNVIRGTGDVGGPDFIVDIPDSSNRSCLECKNLLSQKQLGKRLEKANKQIRPYRESHYGVVALKAPGALLKVANDDIPEHINEYKKEIENKLGGENFKSVNSVILLWDDAIVLGNPPQKMSVALRSRYLEIKHSPTERMRPLPESLSFYEGFTVYYSMNFKSRSQ